MLKVFHALINQLRPHPQPRPQPLPAVTDPATVRRVTALTEEDARRLERLTHELENALRKQQAASSKQQP